MSMRAPFVWEYSADAPARTVLSTAQVIIGEVHESGTVTEVSIVMPAAAAAETTSYRIFTIQNRGTAGTGTVTIATIDTSTTGFTAYDERVATLATAANRLVEAGAVLAVSETVNSSGVAHNGYKVTVKVSRT